MNNISKNYLTLLPTGNHSPLISNGFPSGPSTAIIIPWEYSGSISFWAFIIKDGIFLGSRLVTNKNFLPTNSSGVYHFFIPEKITLNSFVDAGVGGEKSTTSLINLSLSFTATASVIFPTLISTLLKSSIVIIKIFYHPLPPPSLGGGTKEGGMHCTLYLNPQTLIILCMKALILAAGKGTRLLPLTADRPKVMLDFGGHPLLCYHVRLLKHYGITDIWINTNWFPESIFDYFGDGSKFGVNIHYSEEKELLGTAGALNPLKDVFKGEQFLITQGDNLTNFNYKKLIDFHNQKKAFFTLGLFNSPEPWTQGMVETDNTGRVTKLIEKPDKKDVTTNQVNAGIYICEPGLLDLIPPGFYDFGFDVFPDIIKKKLPLYGLSTGDYVQDTGTHERLAKAQSDLPSLQFPFKFT